MRTCLSVSWLFLLLLEPGTHSAVPAETGAIDGPLKYEEPKFLTGAIYSRDQKQLVFRFSRVAKRSGTSLNVERNFTYADGKLAASETVVYDGDSLVSYELKEMQVEAGGSAKIVGPNGKRAGTLIQFQYSRQPGSRPKTRTEALQPNTLIADMVGPFLAAHWDNIQAGQKVGCRYIVVPRCETIGFNFVKESEERQGSQAVITVRMEPSSVLIAPLVKPLYFTMEIASPHRVLKYTGRTTPKIREGSKWQDLDGVTVFDWESAR